jgi:hypothetical protein
VLAQRREAAQRVAAALFETEAAIDVALAKAAYLSGAMPALRKAAGASALIGQDALEHVSEAFTALTEARRAIVEAHRQLSVAQAQVGLGAVPLTDDIGDKPPPPHAGDPRSLRRLRAV